MFHWILEVGQSNALILYRLSRPPPAPGKRWRNPGFKIFKQELVSQLLIKASSLALEADEDLTPRKQEGRPRKSQESVVRFSKNTRHLVMHTDKDRNCVYCSSKESRKRTTYVCIDCPGQPHLHPKDCFFLYHNDSH